MDLKMEVYTPGLELIGFLEIQRSVIWSEKAFSSGSFSLESLITAESLALLQPENIIWIEGETAGIIEYVHEEAGQDGPYIVVKGYTLTGILKRRILWGRYDLKGTVPQIMCRLVDDCAIHPTRGDVEARKIPGLVLDEALPPASRLPDGYTELEYIQSSGTQYINTGYKANGNTRVKMDVDILPKNPETAGIFGGRDGGLVNTFSMWKISNSGFRMDYGATAYTLDFYPFGRHLIDQNKNTTAIDDFSFTENAVTFQADTVLTILAISSLGTPDDRMLRAKIYSCQIYDNGTPVRDYVPCTDPSGTVGLYDAVGKSFYGNAGTGTFAAGPAAQQTARASTGGGTVIHIQKTGGDLLEALEELGETYGVPFGVRFNPAVPQMEFWTRWGQNRSIHQTTNEPVFYSTELDDVLSSEYVYNAQDYCNVALVSGEGEGNDRTMVTVENEVEESPDVPTPQPPEPPATEKYTVTLLVDPAGGGIASGGKTVASGVSITVTAAPSDGFTFVGWKENGAVVSTSTAYTFVVTGDRTLTAVFAAVIRTYTITASIDPAGSGTVTGAGQYQEGESVTLKATVADGYKFSGWQESGQTVSTEAEYTFTVSGDRTLVAMFEAKKVSRLPDGYTEVEYILTNANFGIDTGIKANASTTRFVMDIQYQGGSADYFFFATSSVSASGLLRYFALGVYQNSLFFYRDNSASFGTITALNTGERGIIDYNCVAKTLTVGSAKKTINAGNYTFTSNTYLGKAANTDKSATYKLYSSKIYTNGVLNRDFVPCINPSGVVGLYDLVGQKFYKNAWSGTPTAGPAV